MDISISHHKIKEMCGTVSFKKGDYFYRANKVTFSQYSHDFCEASVSGTEDFQVTIEKDAAGKTDLKCSCPSLVNFQKHCQHIAAVLLSIQDYQRKGTVPDSLPVQSSNYDELTKGFLTVFNNRPARRSGHQLHFEKREVLDVMFTCRPVKMENGQFLFGMEIKVGNTKLKNIQTFLQDVRHGERSALSSVFTYDPSRHCFLKEDDLVIQELIGVIHYEKAFLEALSSSFSGDNESLLIPPSSWTRLAPLLTTTSLVRLKQDDQSFESLRMIDGPPPIQFTFEVKGTDYRLAIDGFDRMIVLNPYRSVLFDGKVYTLNEQDCERLNDLKQMLFKSGTNHIPISHKKIQHFLDNIVPSLKKIGDVQLDKALSQKLLKKPLVAKLYLDRVKNRLLCGLEFHYEDIIIQPLEQRETLTGPVVVRDQEKEDEILGLMDESGFFKTDGGYTMQNETLEYSFLFHTVPKLQQLVQIYATTAVRNRIVRKNAFPKIRVKVKKERNDWLEFKFEMDEIADQQIREILEALEEKRKYYRLRNGSLLSLETKEMEEIQRFLKKFRFRILIWKLV